MNAFRFFIHSVSVEIRGPRANELAALYSYFLHRPEDEGQTTRFSVSVELGAFAAPFTSRQGNFSYAKFPDWDVKSADSFVLREILHFLGLSGLHPVNGSAAGLPDHTSLLILHPSFERREALMRSLFSQGPFALLSMDRPLIGSFGQAFAFPLQKPVIPGAQANFPATAIGNEQLARPNESFRPGFLVIAKDSGNDEPEVCALPAWRANISLLSALGLPAKGAIVRKGGSRILAASSFASRAKAFRLKLSGNAAKDATALLQAISPHGKR